MKKKRVLKDKPVVGMTDVTHDVCSSKLEMITLMEN